ncbi:hypothetical protein Misp06_00034 [Microbulbifer sp. NBRC 101763]|uniref:hypothetical protein n=1 Tax=unclassified Microbulbifer TaxID=2619833 RepID=UPI00309D863B
MKHCIIERDGERISVDEWREVASGEPNFLVTDKLIQQNPFTKEFLEIEIPGSGYWVPSSMNLERFPYDGKVRFHFTEHGVRFIQYENPFDSVFTGIARKLGARVKLKSVDQS